MAATVRNLCKVAWLALLLRPVAADQASDVLDQISSVTMALSAGNPSDAMGPFDKSLPDYDKLQNDFIALTAAYKLRNEVDVADEQDGTNESNLTVNWVMTLENYQTNSSDQRTGEIKIHLIRKNKKWKIVGFSPVDFFDPLYSKAKSSS